MEPVTYGGGQEHGLRAGTENVALAVTLGAAADLARAELAASSAQHLQTLRDRLHGRLADALPGRVLLNGHPEHRLPNTLNLSITGIRGDELLAATTGVAASTGSACHAGATEPSPVLIAMGLDPARALAAIRLTVGRWSTQADIDGAADALTTTIRGRHHSWPVESEFSSGSNVTTRSDHNAQPASSSNVDRCDSFTSMSCRCRGHPYTCRTADLRAVAGARADHPVQVGTS